MDVLKEQHVCIKSCQKLGKTTTETYGMLQQAFGETALRQSNTFEWYSRFKNEAKVRQVWSNVKTMLIAFFDAEGLVHHEFLPQRHTVNQSVYITVLQRLRDAVRRKRPHKWSSGTWLLHHDSVPCQAALNVREFLAKHSIPVVPHWLTHQIWPPATSSFSPG
jgi:hypothetical protein